VRRFCAISGTETPLAMYACVAVSRLTISWQCFRTSSASSPGRSRRRCHNDPWIRTGPLTSVVSTRHFPVTGETEVDQIG